MDQQTEDETRIRERAIWPDEPEPFEDRFWQESQESHNHSSESTSNVAVVAGHSLTPVNSETGVPEVKTARPTVDSDGNVWLNGAPPKDFPFLETPAPSPAPGEPWPDPLRPFEPPFVPVAYTPESTADSVRRSGLAWSAGIVFFASVSFMLFVGWIADLLLGSSPWGIVGGVVLGSLIGFIQFFRISSQIYSPRPSEHKPLLSRDDEL